MTSLKYVNSRAVDRSEAGHAIDVRQGWLHHFTARSSQCAPRKAAAMPAMSIFCISIIAACARPEAAMHNDAFHVFAFSEDGEQPMVGLQSWYEDEIDMDFD